MNRICEYVNVFRALFPEKLTKKYSLRSLKVLTAGLLDLFAWTEDQFDRRMRGSAIRRIGYQRWLRNFAVAIGRKDL